MRIPTLTPSLVAALVLAALPTLPGPAGAPLAGQAADSVRVVEAMHELQRDFERFRESHTPVDRGGRDRRPSGVCDEFIGRICIWFGGEDEEDFPGELREVQQARGQLMRELSTAWSDVKDPWILGQLVHYVVEAREFGEADRVTTACGLAGSWWCEALRGYALHVRGRHTDAEEAFREALATMPTATREAWTTPRYVLSPDAVERFEALTPDERERQWELLWTLSDPLFLFNGNDRLTDHFARLVEAENRRDAMDPLQLEWEQDLEETLVRYGRNTGYSRSQELGNMGALNLRDTRRMVGHHHPMSRGYLFPERFLESPSDIPPESWITAPREARTWYAPPYAPDMRGLETQVGRFRRDGRMLVVGAYRPTVPDEEEGDRVVAAWGGEADDAPGGPPVTGFFLYPVDGGERIWTRGDDPEGVLTLEAPPGRYVSGLEVVDVEGKRAWRARQGVAQLPLPEGLVDVSDLMLLKEGAPLPTSLDDALPWIRPGVRLRRGERFGVLWEAYGLRVLEPVRVTVGFTRGRPGFLARVGEFLGVIEPERPVDITFQDAGPDRLQTAFRAVELELPDLDPGEYTLHLRLELAGREPVTTSRPIVVERQP